MGLNFSVYKQCDKKGIFSDSPTMNARIPLLLCVWTFLSFQGKILVRVGSRDWRSTLSCKVTLNQKGDICNLLLVLHNWTSL